MSSKNLAAGGLVGYALGGGLLLIALLPRSLPALVLVGGFVLWLGLGAVLVAVLQVGRANHRLLRTPGDRPQPSTTGSATSAPTGDGAVADVSPDASQILERLEALEWGIDARFESRNRDVLRVVDARILGIHETVRDLLGPAGPEHAGPSPSAGDAGPSRAGDPTPAAGGDA